MHIMIHLVEAYVPVCMSAQ